MTDGQVNYEAYSDLELREALLSIDRQAFPQNYRNLAAMIEARASQSGATCSTGAGSSPPEAAPEVSPEILEFEQLLIRLTPRTPATYALIAINVLVFAAMAWAGAGILEPDSRVHVRWGSNFVPITVGGEWWRLGTSVFLHFGLVHLLVNMWVLYANGQLVERLFGSMRFTLLYIVAGVCGSLASAAWNPVVNSAGASGAIFGVLGGLAAFLLVKKCRVPREIVRQQGKSVLIFVLFNVVNGITHEGIDNAAHLGGLVGGMLMGLALARPLTEEARQARRVPYVTGVMAAVACGLVLSAIFVRHTRERLTAEDRFIAGVIWFEHGEPRAMGAYNDMVEAAHAKDLGDGDFARRLSEEVIPFYAEARERLAWNPQAASPVDDTRARIERYVSLRHESMLMLEHALRSDDHAKAAMAMQLQDESDALAKEIAEAAGAKPASEP